MAIRFEEVAFGTDAYKKLLELRYEVLRKPIGMELREKDIALDHEEYHVAAFNQNHVIGCALLKPIDANTIRLRQVAIADTHQGQGIGAKLVTFAEKIAVQKGYKTIETKARKTAQKFYEKLGYMFLEDANPLDNIHVIQMHKPLSDTNSRQAITKSVFAF